MTTEIHPPNQPWTRSPEEILQDLHTGEDGLQEEEVQARREQFGPNRLRQTKSKSAWQILLEQFQSLVVLLLVAAAVIALIFGELTEAVAITAVILINAAIGFFTELRAVRSMEALQELTRLNALVRRNGKTHEINADDLVPGDIVLIESGDKVAADLRLVEAARLEADESPLTGESVPVGKETDPIEGDVTLAERSNMLFKGTIVTRGTGEGVVVSTGMDTQLGEITELVEEAEQEATPLEKRLDQLGQRLVFVTLGIALALIAVGFLVGKELFLIIETAIALAVATVPEGLPIVASLALARGMWRMARRNALINRLSAVETLGATDVICTDKTGTLTENRMTVVELLTASKHYQVSGEGLDVDGEFQADGSAVEPENEEALLRLLRTGMLCNNAALQLEQEKAQDRAVGEPLEVALLVAARKAGLQQDDLRDDYPEVREVAFDPDIKMMATIHEDGSSYHVAVKGAVEEVLNQSSSLLEEGEPRDLTGEDRDQWTERNETMAQEGLRVLALAERRAENADEDPYQNLTFLGLVGLLDPAREDVRPSLEACEQAGIRVVMVTGDHPATARKIAQAVRLVTEEDAAVVQGHELKPPQDLGDEERQRMLAARIFARVSPRQKLDLISLHQDNNSIVAMTGDGVNDAPALKKADIGVAMGQRGTEAAKEAADMVLRDDAFSSIVAAVRQGRTIFGNIRNFVFYLLSCNISEILVVSIASFANTPLPIRPLQILFLNLVTDVFPALAMGVGEGDPAIMQRPPRPSDEPVISRGHWLAIGGYGLLMTAAVLGVFALALEGMGLGEEQAVTLSFLTLAFAQLWHVFNMRARNSGLLRNEITGNVYVWAALALTVGLLIAAVYLPGLSGLLRTVDPGLQGWAIVLGASVFPLVVGQILKWMGGKWHWKIPF